MSCSRSHARIFQRESSQFISLTVQVKCDQESKVLVLCDDQLRTSLGGIDVEMVTFLKRVQIPIDGKPETWEASASDGLQQLRVKIAKGRFATIEYFLYPGMDESPADIR
jgi:hypothetical protein